MSLLELKQPLNKFELRLQFVQDNFQTVRTIKIFGNYSNIRPEYCGLSFHFYINPSFMMILNF